VDDSSVVVDRALGVALAGGDASDLLEQAVALAAEPERPGERAAPRDRAEALEVAGVEELAQPQAAGLGAGVRPEELAEPGRDRIAAWLRVVARQKDLSEELDGVRVGRRGEVVWLSPVRVPTGVAANSSLDSR
jgi:hypothetical protein